MGNIVIIGGGIVALLIAGLGYYIYIPAMFNTKAFFDSRVTDPVAIAISDAIYNIMGISLLIFVGVIFINMYTKATRDHSQSVFG